MLRWKGFPSGSKKFLFVTGDEKIFISRCISEKFVRFFQKTRASLEVKIGGVTLTWLPFEDVAFF